MDTSEGAYPYPYPSQALYTLMIPLQMCVDQGDLAPQLALKIEECMKLHIPLKHQRDEKNGLQAALNIYI